MFFSLPANFPVSAAANAVAIGKASVSINAALPVRTILRRKEISAPLCDRRGSGEIDCVGIAYTRYSLLQERQQPRQMSRLGFRSGTALGLGAAGLAPPCRSVTLSLPSSMRVENFTVPSSEISTRGVVPLMPMVATGVSTFMSPVFAILPATKVNVPLVRLSRVEFDLLFGS